jgi:hypothetical protein
MSIPVDLDALRDQLARHERPAYLITAGASGGPHLVSVYLTWEDGTFTAGCGRHTAANLAERPEVSVVVPPDERDGYSLIFDATGEVVEGEERTVRLTPVKAVLHRPAAGPDGAGGCGHDCAPVGST